MADLKIALVADANNPVVGDLYLENGTVRLTRTLAEAVAQELYIRLKFFLGEWFADPTLGVPWVQVILGSKAPQALKEQILRRVIIGCPGVAELKSFAMTTTAERMASLSFAVKLSDGTTLTSADFTPFTVGA